jgi:hypothetical protein
LDERVVTPKIVGSVLYKRRPVSDFNLLPLVELTGIFKPFTSFMFIETLLASAVPPILHAPELVFVVIPFVIKWF